MNIFVAGIHGVGKTYIASQAAPLINMKHTSASALIREERALSSWGVDKRVTDVAENQLALASAVRRQNQNGIRLLLDGHFVLKGEDNNFILLEPNVFITLNLNGVLVIEEAIGVVMERLKTRDNQNYPDFHITEFMKLERSQAEKICTALSIPLKIIKAPTLEQFLSETVSIDSHKKSKDGNIFRQ